MDLSDVWTEKYRPRSLDDVVGHAEIVARLRGFVESGSIPHMLFAGPAGTGKTTTAIAVAREFFGEQWRYNFLEKNASDERGIDVVRSTIKDFARTKAIGTAFKIIFLDECDALTRDAQNALRRTMENYSLTCRFILSCNYSSRIIDPIQSRCAVFRFSRLAPDGVKEMAERIRDGENLTIGDKALAAVVDLSRGDLRRTVNVLQASAALDKEITEDEVYQITSELKGDEVRDVLTTALGGDFLAARGQLQDLMIMRGMAGEDVVRAIHRAVLALDVAEETKVTILDRLGEYEFRMAEGANEYIQLDALLANLTLLGKRS